MWTWEGVGWGPGGGHGLVSSPGSILVRSERTGRPRGRPASLPAERPLPGEPVQVLCPAQAHSAPSLFQKRAVRRAAGDLLTPGFDIRK